jgi:hypothetical protein
MAAPVPEIMDAPSYIYIFYTYYIEVEGVMPKVGVKLFHTPSSDGFSL